MNKEDIRYITADRKIRKAFCMLLRDSSIDRVSTGDIISAAGVHKSTFYSHYRDKYDLLSSIEDDLIDVLYPCLEKIFIGMLKENCSQEELVGYHVELARLIFAQEESFRLILRGQSGSIIPKIYERIKRIWHEQDIDGHDSILGSYLVNAVTYVITGTIENWIRRECTDPVEVFIPLMDAVGISIRHVLSSV